MDDRELAAFLLRIEAKIDALLDLEGLAWDPRTQRVIELEQTVEEPEPQQRKTRSKTVE